VRARVRGILAGLAAIASGIAIGSPEIIAAIGDARTLSIYNVHTKETVTVLYKKDGQYIPAAMQRISHIMRDWRESEEHAIDGKLVDIIWEMHEELGSREPVHLLSGYRSPKTNEALRENVGGQAKNSRHMLGKAADIHFPDVPIRRMRYSALVREKGGVGYYPTSAIPFVHVDTDRVRHWPPMPRYELALLFPDGQTRHVPSDGTPITREDVKVAQARHKDLAVQIAEYFEVRQKPDPNRMLLASLSGPFPVAAPAPKAPAPRPVAGPRLASLTGGPLQALGKGVIRKEIEATEQVTGPPVAAAPLPLASKPALAPREDALGALLARELASLSDGEGAKPAAATAPARVAAADPRAAASEPAERITGDTLKSWPTGWAQAPAFDEEHPDELSYRPFPVGPILTLHTGADHPVLARMQHPDTARIFELLDEPDRVFPIAFRPGKQTAELLWASQFSGAKVSAETLYGRMKQDGSGPLRQRQVATTATR
jgi:uncharacterized protein YcbK (DUF882 family)